MKKGTHWIAAAAAYSCLLACTSSTASEAGVDPRWSGPPRTVAVTRTFEVGNASQSQGINVRFDTPDISRSMNVVAVSRRTSLPSRRTTPAANGMDRIEFDVQIPPGGAVDLTITWDLSLRRFDALALDTPPSEISPSERAAYLEASARVESDHPTIQEAAFTATQGLSDPLAQVEAIVAFVRGHLVYELQPETRGALWALEQGRGDCTEYAALGVALARAAGIPARVAGVENMVATTGSSTYDNHNASEFWIDDYGWVPVDINYRDSPIGVLPVRSVVLRWGLFTNRDRDSHSVSWYTWRTISGPIGQLEVRSMGHEWTEG